MVDFWRNHSFAASEIHPLGFVKSPSLVTLKKLLRVREGDAEFFLGGLSQASQITLQKIGARCISKQQVQ